MTEQEIEWKKWRLTGIGASDAPVITGKSKYRTILELFDEKFNKKIDLSEPNFAQSKGHALEINARAWYEFETGLKWTSCRFTNPDMNFIIATFDGYNKDLHEGWECKHLGKDDYLKLINESLPVKERIPEQYFDQLMHQFLASGVNAIRLTGVCDSLNKEVKEKRMHTITVKMDDSFKEYIKNELLPRELDFWQHVTSGVRPVYKFELKKQKDIDSFDKYRNLVLGISMTTVEFNEYKQKLNSILEENNTSIIKYKNFELSKESIKTINYKNAIDAFVGWVSDLKKLAAEDGTPEALDSIIKSIESFPTEPDFSKFNEDAGYDFILTVTEEPKPETEQQPKKESKNARAKTRTKK